MRSPRSQVLCLALLILSVVLAPAASACLLPVTPISTSIQHLGTTNAGFEQLQVHVEGFELADFSESGVGCTIALGTQSRIVGGPLFAIQDRMVTYGLTVVEQATGLSNDKFLINPSLILDFMGEALGLGLYSWPIPVAFATLTIDQDTAASGDLPHGPVELIFHVLVKPTSNIADAVADLDRYGTVASDYSLTYAGITYLLWNATPFATEMDIVFGP